MLPLSLHLLLVPLVFSSQVVASNNDPLSKAYRTTTAVPLYSNNVSNGHTPSILNSPRTTTTSTTTTTTSTTVAPLNNGEHTTKPTFENSTILSRLSSIAITPIGSTNVASEQTTVHNFVTTTARPLRTSMGHESYNAFDGVSFGAGILFTIVVVTVANFGWRAYKAYIDRSYWTL